jgi:hypothetical protein
MEMFPRGRYDEGSGTGAEKEIETDGEWAGSWKRELPTPIRRTLDAHYRQSPALRSRLKARKALICQEAVVAQELHYNK